MFHIVKKINEGVDGCPGEPVYPPAVKGNSVSLGWKSGDKDPSREGFCYESKLCPNRQVLPQFCSTLAPWILSLFFASWKNHLWLVTLLFLCISFLAIQLWWTFLRMVLFNFLYASLSVVHECQYFQDDKSNQSLHIRKQTIYYWDSWAYSQVILQLLTSVYLSAWGWMFFIIPVRYQKTLREYL